jgi:cytochrome P450 family 6
MLNGADWKLLRTKLTPTFSSGNIKNMFSILLECGEELKTYLSRPADNNETIEIKDILGRFSTDVISSCAFGIQTNSLKNPDAEFRKMGKSFFAPGLENSVRFTIPLFLPTVVRMFKVNSLIRSAHSASPLDPCSF